LTVFSQAENERLLQSLTEDCDGIYGTLEQAVSELDIPRIKVTKSMPSFKGNLMLGNPEEYDTAITIPVERYFRTYVAKPISASSFVPRSGTEPGSQVPGKGDGGGEALTAVRTMRTYQITDETAPGGKVDVERDDLAKGYEYGRTAVAIEQADESITNVQTFAGMGIIGFILMDKVRLSKLISTFTG
jgi:ATP-dependent DNA helicase 2 subunit 2